MIVQDESGCNVVSVTKYDGNCKPGRKFGMKRRILVSNNAFETGNECMELE